MSKKAIFKGCDHVRCMFWFSELPVPPSHRIIKKGLAMAGDLVMVPQGPFPQRVKSGTDVKIKAAWETVKQEYVGTPVKRFRVVIRKTVTEKRKWTKKHSYTCTPASRNTAIAYGNPRARLATALAAAILISGSVGRAI